MNSDIGPVKVAERLVDSVRHGLAHVPSLPPVSGTLGDGKTQFKWHIEPGHTWRFRIKLNAREIMDRMGTLLNEFQYSIKPTLARGYFERSPRYEPKRTQTGNISQIQVLKGAVVRDVQEYRVPLSPFLLSFGHISRSVHVRLHALASEACARTAFAERAPPQQERPQEYGRSLRDLGRAFRL